MTEWNTLEQPSPLRVVASEASGDAGEEQLMAEGYRVMADLHTQLAEEFLSAQRECLPSLNNNNNTNDHSNKNNKQRQPRTALTQR